MCVYMYVYTSMCMCVCAVVCECIMNKSPTLVVIPRQVSGQEVQIWGRLFWVDDTNMTTSPHNWHIHESAPGEDYRVGMCGDVGPHYDPTGRGPTSAPNYSTLCTPDTPDMCEIGDLTRKHGPLSVTGEFGNDNGWARS